VNVDILKSNTKSGTAAFKSRVKQYIALIGRMHANVNENSRGGSGTAIKKHTERGKLMARERINLLVDEDTAFLELSPLAALGQYNDDFPGAGIITGIGVVHNREVVVIANDATVKGGTYVAETIKKHLRAQQIALENNLPCFYLVDSGGIFLPEQARVFPDRHDFGRIFYNQAVLSSLGIPQISAVMGSCTAGGAYVPAMSDETVIVKGQGTIFLGGPPLVKAATGETVTAEELGGASVHTSVSGVADHMALNDEHAIHICRNIAESFPQWEKQDIGRTKPEEPLYDPAELYGLLTLSSREIPDAKEIIARIVDGSRFHEFRTRYATTLITGFARIMGYPVGILANQGVLYPESALKGTHFIELCNFRKIPMLFLQNVSGFMVGRDVENRGIAREGAKMVHAVATSVVPAFTIITGGSYGAGNYAMAGRAYDPRLLFMYPGARISVMGAEQATQVLSAIGQNEKETVDMQAERKLQNQAIYDTYDLEGSPYYSTSRIWDDGIIDPADTRRIVAMGIAMSLNKKFPDPANGIYRM
jgi:3-methylcrotonyl-CoA carboxylase beta subunit